MIRRNDPCPCGSGRRFKSCCLLTPPSPGNRTTGPFQFEPGSYGGPGGYAPSLACFRESSSGQKEYHYVLANPRHVFDSEDGAVARAMADFSHACRVDYATGSFEAVGRQLSALGYVIIENFRVVGENA
jgi:hypothetical protein